MSVMGQSPRALPDPDTQTDGRMDGWTATT